MSIVTIRPGRRVTLAPFLDARVVGVARDGTVKLELIATGTQLAALGTGQDPSTGELSPETVDDRESSRFFAEFA